jgi:phosphoribosyl-AMP cyclohydrolase
MPFAPRGSAAEIEEGRAFAPKFDAAGLITCVVTAADSGEVLMVAHMNDQALTQTLETGEAWFYSRSRQALWKKGETSGHVQLVVEMRVDCDQDVLLLKVAQAGPGACHTGRRSCFYRAVIPGAPGTQASLEFRDAERAFDPAQVYGPAGTR